MAETEISVERLRQALQRAQAFFFTARERAAAARFMRERGLSVEVADQYGCGYAPDDWQGLVEAIADNEAALEIGLAAQAASGHVYAKFRDRFMFPIRDGQGDLCGFGGRLLSTADSDAPKYLNSNQSELFNKRAILYGLPEALEIAGPNGAPRLVVAEGFVDVIAPAQSGLPNFVAPMGTALTEAQIDLLYTHTDEVILCFDGDAAGREAIDRAIENVLPVVCADRRLRIAELPDGYDPDTFVRTFGPDGLTRMLDQAVPVGRYLVHACIGYGEPVATAFEALRPLVKRLADVKTQYDLLADFASRYAGVRLDALIADDPELSAIFDSGIPLHRDTQPLNAPITPNEARGLVARALFACPDVARFVDIPEIDIALSGEPALIAIDMVANEVSNHGCCSSAHALELMLMHDETRPLVDMAVQGGVLSPALAREAVMSGGTTLLDRTAPGFATGQGLAPPRFGP